MTKRGLKQVLSAAAFGAALCGVHVSIASAATVTVSVSANKLRYVAGTGEVNKVTVVPVGSYLEVSESGTNMTLTNGAGCEFVNSTKVRCLSAGITSILLDLGDLDDVVWSDSSLPTTVLAGNGGDTVKTGDGNDYVAAGEGNNFVYSFGGTDTIVGGTGNDTFSGGGGVDTIMGSDGNNSLHGDAGDDWIHGGSGDDTITGGEGNDVIYAYAGRDVVYGDGGNDTIDIGRPGQAGNEEVYGGDGVDTINIPDPLPYYSFNSVDMNPGLDGDSDEINCNGFGIVFMTAAREQIDSFYQCTLFQ